MNGMTGANTAVPVEVRVWPGEIHARYLGAIPLGIRDTWLVWVDGECEPHAYVEEVHL